MKIQSLHFKNLNALYGEWKIDFTHEDYQQSGIFALTGPTGSGKSSILDAICLALYGYTPRLGNITKSSNEIMSRLTGECFAELTFLAQNKQYTCRWEQRRAKKKPHGALQNPSYEMSETKTGTILANSRADVLQLVEKTTGMNYERFTRTMLLSQGKFDAFLQAKVEEKSSILEEITGTEIYTKISSHVHDKLRAKKEELALIIAENAHISLLSEEEIAHIHTTLKNYAEQENILQQEKEKLQAQKEWITKIQHFETEIETIKKDSIIHQQKIQEFLPEKQRLERALKASELDIIYTEFNALRKEQGQDISQIKHHEKEETEIKKEVEQSTKSYLELEKTITKIKEEIQTITPLLQKVRLLDQHIFLQQQNLEKNKNTLNTEKEKLKKHLETTKKYTKNKEMLTKKIQALELWQTENQHNALLISEYSAINEQLKNLAQLLKEGLQERQPEKENKKKLLELEKLILDLTKKQVEETKDLVTIKKEEKDLQLALKQLLENKTLQDYQEKKEALLREKALVVRIITLEEERKQLEDNTPCPLCGATSHPYALGNIPEITPIEKDIQELDTRILAIINIEKKMHELNIKEHALNLQILNTKNTLENTTLIKEKVSEEHKRQLNLIQKRLEEYYSKNTAIIQSLKTIKIDTIPKEGIRAEAIPVLQKELASRLLMWENKQKEKQEYEKEVQALITNIATNNAITQGYIEKQNTLEQAYSKEEKELAENQIKRQQLFALKNPDIEEKLIQNKLHESEQKLVKAYEQKEKDIKILHNIQTRCKTLQEQVTRRAPLLMTKEKIFFDNLVNKELINTSLKNQNFSQEEYSQFLENTYLQACLAPEIRSKIEKEQQQINELSKELEIKLTHSQAKLDSLLQKKLLPTLYTEHGEEIKYSQTLFTTTLQNITQELEKKSLDLKEMSEKSIVLSQDLIRNQKSKELNSKIEARIQLHKNELKRIEKLHDLIGSADGKKYRNFAQGLTFELLINHANKQLAKMSDRYLLQHDTNAPLKLNVIDHYQGEELRTTNNLSGGESFIVSLALALGLSQMVSQKIRVDSLFLDEGFGTLDEEALETALEALTQLTNYTKERSENNKIIGIISHISALKDRIPIQIQLIPENGGKSKILGSGCENIL